MWQNANVLWRSNKHRGGKEVGGFILKDGRILVLPDYNNDSRTSGISNYGYNIKNAGKVIHGKEILAIVAQIHTHQDKSGDANPSFYEGDDKVSELLKRPVFTMSHDGNVWYILSNKNTYVANKTPYKIKDLLSGKTERFSKYASDKQWSTLR